MEFLERALGFTRGVVLPDADGQLRYAEMRHDGLGRDADPQGRRDDADRRRRRALHLRARRRPCRRAGTRGRAPASSDAEDRPWGDRVATVTDPDGYRWVLATFKKLAPFG